jgi:hypothetical protein
VNALVLGEAQGLGDGRGGLQLAPVALAVVEGEADHAVALRLGEGGGGGGIQPSGEQGDGGGQQSQWKLTLHGDAKEWTPTIRLNLSIASSSDACLPIATQAESLLALHVARWIG